jgi:hypothetical protein
MAAKSKNATEELATVACAVHRSQNRPRTAETMFEQYTILLYQRTES